VRLFPVAGDAVEVSSEDGLKLIVRGSISVYEPRGEYQIYVEHIEPAGVGALQLAFETIKKAPRSRRSLRRSSQEGRSATAIGRTRRRDIFICGGDFECCDNLVPVRVQATRGRK